MAKKSLGGKVALGAGLAAVAVAAAGAAYFFTGKGGAKNRKKVQVWAFKAKAEVLEQLERLGHVTEKEYAQVVKAVLARYQKLPKVDAKDVAAVAAELNRHWRSIRREVEKKAKKIVPSKKRR